ncbi:transcriptional coactivator/pterin dehydratase, partial [Sphaerosporella brunnea]
QWSSASSEPGRSAATALLESRTWTLSSTRDGLEREFVFPGFVKAMRFINLVADECRLRKHHPEWANVYDTVRVRWTTHNPKGLSDKDVEMAKFCDEKAAEVG